jgi:KDO2-lipid IV(A) lauroyltransferase
LTQVSKAREILEYYYYLLNVGVVRALPEQRARRLSSWVAERIFAWNDRHVKTALANVRVAFPEKGEAERREIGLQSYLHTAWGMLDAALAKRWSDAELLRRARMVGRDHLDKALDLGRGALVLTLHFGSIELALMTTPLHGIPLTVIGRPLPNPRIRRDMRAQRTRTGAELIEHRGVAPEILRALRKGRCVAVLNDQYERRSKGIAVPFFGVRSYTSPGIATLSLLSGAPVGPFYIVREAHDRHRCVWLPAINVPRSGDVKRDIAIATERYNTVLEEIIREHPEQWMWSHRRFRHSPDLPRDLYAF